MNFNLLQALKPSADACFAPGGGLQVIEELFDHVPETAFFVKDHSGRYLAVNQSLVERCGVKSKNVFIGRSAREIFPRELGDVFSRQDEMVIKTGRNIIDHLELHWYASRRPGWCLTTKLPIRDGSGAVAGLVGISRDLRAPGDTETIPPSLASTLEYLEAHPEDLHSPGSLAERAGLPPVRFARLIKRIFRLSPNHLILQTRLAAAEQLLRETDRSVADIAYACGFYDHSAMTRAFRSATGLTPSQFRDLRERNGSVE